MQDRFKFRVFISDKKNSKNSLTGMFKVHSLHMGTNKAIITSLYGNCSIKLENNILMQCTGFKDKNGKLIYEGDIVRFKDNITINGSKTHISVIEHNEAFNTFMYHAECMGLYTVNETQNKQFNVEVIGNIYENPELLEAE